MTTESPSPASLIRLAFWRAAASTTDIVLRNREQLLSATPYLVMLAGGLLAYAIGYHVGLVAFGPIP